jgi:hypothetical protein
MMHNEAHAENLPKLHLSPRQQHTNGLLPCVQMLFAIRLNNTSSGSSRAPGMYDAAPLLLCFCRYSSKPSAVHNMAAKAARAMAPTLQHQHATQNHGGSAKKLAAIQQQYFPITAIVALAYVQVSHCSSGVKGSKVL